MKVKPTLEVLYYDNTPVKDESKKTVLLRDLIINAINAPDQGTPMSVTEKSKVFEISLKMFSGDEIELSDDEIDLIVKKAEVILVPLALGRLKEILQK